MEFGHNALEVGEVYRQFPGSLFEHCAFAFSGSLAVWVIVGAVEVVLEFLDGVEVDSVIDDIDVNHSVSVAFEERHDVHYLVLVIAEVPGVDYQFHL